MVVCQVINIICLFVYFCWCIEYLPNREDGKDNSQDEKEMSDNEVTAVTFGYFMGPLLFVEFLLPIWLLHGEGFLSKYNFIFNTNYTVTYEGGMISILLTMGPGMILAALIYNTLRHSLSLREYNRKAFIKGVLWAAVIYVALGMSYLMCISGYNPDSDKRYYKTQMQKEEHEIDRQIESDKNRLIKKAVDDYRKQWED